MALAQNPHVLHIATLQSRIEELEQRLGQKDLNIEALKTEVIRLRRWRLGRSAETLDPRVALTRYVEDGAIEIDNNAAERAIRALVLGRRNYLCAGSDAGGETATTLATTGSTSSRSRTSSPGNPARRRSCALPAPTPARRKMSVATLATPSSWQCWPIPPTKNTRTG
jgi:hypothetical protein